MTIRIRPEEIDAPPEDPFKFDLLDRKKSAEVLTDVVGSFRGPGVIALDAAWGAGKTTFLRMWSQKLKNDKFTVVEFNAWDTDFAADPFLALSTELQAGLETSAADIPAASKQGIKKWSKEILRHGVPELVRLALGSVPVVGAVSGQITESIMDQFAESRVSSYTATKQAVSEFRTALECAASAIFDSSGSKPLVVIIDELDRCRPTYAVELLETAKHLFSVDHVVFVLALDREQLVHSICALYGDEFGAGTYLRRFIDAYIHLPNPNRDELVRYGLQVIDLKDVLSKSRDHNAATDASMATDMLAGILRMSSTDIRTVLQALYRLRLVLRSTPEDYPAFLFSLALATVVLIHDEDICRELSEGRGSDEQVIDAVRSYCSVLDWNRSDETPFFEATIIRLIIDQPSDESPESRTPLFAAYEEILRANPEPQDGRAQSIEIRRLRQIQRFIERWRTMGSPKGSSFAAEFNSAFARLDMVSGVAPDKRFRR